MEEKKQVTAAPIGPSRLALAESQRLIYSVPAAKGTRPEDILQPSYWAHVAAKLRAWDRIEVCAEDGTWYCEVQVLEASRVWARVHVLVGPVMLTTADVSQSQAIPEGYEIRHRASKGWSVVRKSDGAVMHDKEQTEDGARKWLKDNGDKLKVVAPA